MQKRVGTFTPIVFHHTHTHLATKLTDVRQALADADQRDAEHGLTPHQIPASVFIRTGLELEEQQ